ncbi:immunity 53 family protein [Arenimonas oryziterrae]|uniref:Uncharacterized protein n=1 Tax=Arenimonas oryziterrae DSM 21050 = YC6267 TaxID=1121015 RepID=A0A091ASA8_9GAMM|nr:immunity 53 family protein [Arenimonas oryziterrae]KFN41874.1 hypothetical protein N789_14730 [Arenimonas oryziterrae DSM 21050 = YC6267]
MSVLRDFQAWYLAQCNGNWEHSYGATISTLDNPGWSVVINLADTALADKEFSETSYGLATPPQLKVDASGRVLLDDTSFSSFVERNEDPNWLVCSVKDRRFEGYGGPQKLEDILTIFLDWAAGTRTGTGSCDAPN